MSKTFKDLVFKPHPYEGGKDCKMFFPNGYGVSVINHRGSYGYPKKWELAVLKGSETSWNICYDTHITKNVLGHLTGGDVTIHMRAVQEL